MLRRSSTTDSNSVIALAADRLQIIFANDHLDINRRKRATKDFERNGPQIFLGRRRWRCSTAFQN
jgi:hypothetical protein